MSGEYQQLVAQAEVRGAAEDWWGLGCVLFERGMWGAAAGCFARVIEGGGEGDARAWCNWGWCAHQMGDEDAAHKRLARARDLAPEMAEAWSLGSQVLLTLGCEAISYARRGVELAPRSAVGHVALALALMNNGEWEEGWQEYEHRFEMKMPELLTRPYRLWRGEGVGHLYIEAEQGFGDSIFALRWVGRAAERADRVTLFVQKELYGLVMECAGLPGNVRVYPMPRPLPVGVDAWVPMMSLPAAMGLGGPGDDERPYLSLGHGTKQWPPRSVGLVWAGGPAHESGHLRDMKLEDLLRLSEVPEVELHSLQVGMGQQQLGDFGCHGLIRDRWPELTNFLDTARVLAGLDLLITVDTAVAHLAGAMGMPVWMLVNQRGTDFRWSRRGDRTGWYSSLKLFRRELGEEWGAVVRRVDAALRELVG